MLTPAPPSASPGATRAAAAGAGSRLGRGPGRPPRCGAGGRGPGGRPGAGLGVGGRASAAPPALGSGPRSRGRRLFMRLLPWLLGERVASPGSPVPPPRGRATSAKRWVATVQPRLPCARPGCCWHAGSSRCCAWRPRSWQELGSGVKLKARKRKRQNLNERGSCWSGAPQVATVRGGEVLELSDSRLWCWEIFLVVV